MGFLTHLSGLRSPVSTYVNLPLTGNVQGDLRVCTDTGDAYTWMNASSSGVITDWNKVTSASYSELIGAPYSTALDIDNAVKVVTGLSINIALLAFNTLTGYWSSLAKMFDGVINQFTAEDSGLEVEDCENQTYVNIQENVNGGFYLPNKGDLDIYTRMLIHGDGVQGSISFVDLLKQPLVSSNAIVDLNVKKFGTGSIKFNGTNSSLAISDASGILMGKYMKGEFYAEPMCLDFWLYSLASGLQPILANIAYDDGYGKTYDAGEYLSVQRLANGHVYANMTVTTNMGMTDTLIEVESTSTVSDNAWHHIAIQKVGGYLQIWIDGVLDATSVAHVESENSGCQALIKFGQLDTAFLNGHLDEIRLSNVERYTTTFTPMAKAYNTSTTPAPTPTIEDISSGAKTVTVHGNARMSGNNPLFGNASLYLDGINSYLSLADSEDWKLSSGVADSYTKLLLHFDNNINDDTGKIMSGSNVSYTTGKFDQGINLNSTSVITSPASTDFNLASEDYTIECFFKLDGSSGRKTICNFTSSSWFALEWGETGSNFSFQPGIGMGYFLAVPFSDTSSWHHIAIVRNGSTYKMYIDGVALATNTSSAPATTTATPVVTIPITNSGAMKIDELRITKGVARYTSNFTPPTLPLVASTLSDYTIDMWVCPETYGNNYSGLIGQWEGTPNLSWLLAFSGPQHYITVYWSGDGTNVSQLLIAPIAIPLKVWTHIALVQHNGSLNLYINGVLGASTTGKDIFNASSIVRIGNLFNGSPFNGYIEEVRISKGIARWATAFTPPSSEYSADSYDKLLLPLNVQTVPNMVLQSVGYVANYVPTSARVVIFEEDIDVMEPNVDLVVAVSRDGGTTFTNVLLAKDQEFGDGTLNLLTGSVDLTSQPNGELLVWKLVTQNNKDCRIRGVSLNWR